MSKTRFSLSMEINRMTRDGTAEPNPSRETKFSGANEDREIFIFPVQLTTYVPYTKLFINIDTEKL